MAYAASFFAQLNIFGYSLFEYHASVVFRHPHPCDFELTSVVCAKVVNDVNSNILFKLHSANYPNFSLILCSLRLLLVPAFMQTFSNASTYQKLEPNKY
jgi:hypothetical protein